MGESRVGLPARGLALAGLLWLAGSGAAAGQPVIGGRRNVAFDRPEAWAMKRFATLNLLTGMGSPRSREPGELELAVEGLSVPALSEEERRVGFDGTKVEDLNKLDAFLRPRLTVGLPARFSLVATYVPPVRVEGVEPHLGGVALARPLFEAPRWRLGLGVAVQAGSVEGGFTCDAATVAAGEDPDRNPFRCESVSHDHYRLRSASVELGAAWRLGGAGRLEPHLALAATALDLEFQVRARYGGFVDRTRLATDGRTWALAAGLSVPIGERGRLTGEALFSPLSVVRPPATTRRREDLVQLRVQAAYRLR